jgi:hypothetical protein
MVNIIEIVNICNLSSLKALNKENVLTVQDIKQFALNYFQMFSYGKKSFLLVCT